MGSFMRYLGVFVVIIGAVILMLYYFGAFSSNSSNSALLTSGFLMVDGVVLYVFLNKQFLEK